ncbi:NAD(P)-dependent oxidoreductase [bacterium]|nr:NAD(P)-dependent oxidoreductase [bacterium]
MNSTAAIEQDIRYILNHTKDLWESLRGRKILMTGGTGFFGKWLLQSFAEANTTLNLNAQLHILSRTPDRFRQIFPYLSEKRGIFFQQGDVRNFSIPEASFDYIIHAATEASVELNVENPLLMVDTIIEGTRSVLDFARSSGAKKVLFVSSGAVYGRQPAELSHIPETYTGGPDLSHPGAAYGEAKRLAELLCSVYFRQYQIETVIARCFAFVGPYLPLDLHFAIGNFIRDGLEKRPIRILGDGTTLRSYLYAADLAIWLWTLLLQGKSGQTYNVGSDREISILELARKVCDAFEDKIEVTVAQQPVPGKVPERYVPDISLAKRELGLDCWIDIDDAIRRTIRFYREIKK